VEVRGGAATGVRLADGEVVAADRVVLTAGAYASPAILQRSGIGLAGPLRALGVDVVADLPGVGENLIDHPLVAVDLPTQPGSAAHVSRPSPRCAPSWRPQLRPTCSCSRPGPSTSPAMSARPARCSAS
jgi:choline dehydrogenase-like flavoprotein